VPARRQVLQIGWQAALVAVGNVEKRFDFGQVILLQRLFEMAFDEPARVLGEKPAEQIEFQRVYRGEHAHRKQRADDEGQQQERDGDALSQRQFIHCR
jgi:hypothetical protein